MPGKEGCHEVSGLRILFWTKLYIFRSTSVKKKNGTDHTKQFLPHYLKIEILNTTRSAITISRDRLLPNVVKTPDKPQHRINHTAIPKSKPRQEHFGWIGCQKAQRLRGDWEWPQLSQKRNSTSSNDCDSEAGDGKQVGKARRANSCSGIEEAGWAENIWRKIESISRSNFTRTYL